MNISTHKYNYNIFIILSLLGSLFIGISHIAFLPPWEGFDETAHYSYLQQIADIGTLPRYQTALMSKDVEDYNYYAPKPYTNIPPFEKNGGYTYKSFFESPPELQKKGYVYIHERPSEPRRYVEGTGGNWQSQHPPLYYIILSPVYLATRHLSWGAQFFILRLISYLFAWSAILIGVFGCLWVIKRNSSAKNEYLYKWMILGLCIWPIFMPSWFPEMARIGNDSLCALIMALIWFCFIKAYYDNLTIMRSIVIGLLLGLGCLTKVFFIPITIAVLSYWLIHQLRFQNERKSEYTWISMVIMTFLIVLISGWWYFENWQDYGVPFGSASMIQLKNQGGLLVGLKEGFSSTAFLRGHAAFIVSFGWSCTWSLARPPYIYLAPMGIIVIFIFFNYMSSLRHHKVTDIVWLPAWILFPLLISFSYHVLVLIALTGEGRGTNGWYLHLMVAPIGVCLGLGLSLGWRKRLFRQITSVLFLYAITFSVVISWAQLLFFSGLIYKSGTNKFYQLPAELPRLLGLPEAYTRLKIIAYPTAGFITWFLGGILILSSIIIVWKLSQELISDRVGRGTNPVITGQ